MSRRISFGKAGSSIGNCVRTASPKVLIVDFSILGNVVPSVGFLTWINSVASADRSMTLMRDVPGVGGGGSVDEKYEAVPEVPVERHCLELKTEKSDLVVSIGPRGDTVANVGFALGRVTR